MKVLFYVRRDRANAEGAPVYFRISINGERLEPPRFTGQRVNPKKWHNQREKGNEPANLILDTIAFKLKSIQAAIIANGDTLTVSRVMNYFDGVGNITLIALAHKFFEHCRQLATNDKLDKEEKPDTSTIKTYEYKFGNIADYLRYSRQNDLPASAVNAVFAGNLLNWLRYEGKELQRSTVARHLTVLKKVVDFGYKKGLLESNPIKDFTYTRGADKEPVNLTLPEVHKIWVYPYDAELQPVADLFLLQCHTGFYLDDVYRFTALNLQLVDGRAYIAYSRSKNGNAAFVPVNEVIQHLITKYNYLWPEISLRRYNELLKRIGDKAGISITLTMKVGRKTFSNIKKNVEGYTPTALAAMMGHKKEDTNKHYSRPGKERVLIEVKSKP